MKTCRKCQGAKPADQFWRGNGRDGLHYWCKDCCRAQSRQWRAENPDRLKELLRRYTVKRYGISEAEFDALLKMQGGGCAICGSSSPSKRPNGRQRFLSIDHDHNHCPGQWGCRECIRGLLCTRCNTGAERYGYDGWPEYAARPRPFAKQRAA